MMRDDARVNVSKVSKKKLTEIEKMQISDKIHELIELLSIEERKKLVAKLEMEYT